jgi:hypothetical protein
VRINLAHGSTVGNGSYDWNYIEHSGGDGVLLDNGAYGNQVYHTISCGRVCYHLLW